MLADVGHDLSPLVPVALCSQPRDVTQPLPPGVIGRAFTWLWLVMASITRAMASVSWTTLSHVCDSRPLGVPFW